MANETFWQYLKNNIPNHLKAIGIVALIVGGVITFNYVRDTRAQRDNAIKLADTLSQKLQQYSNGSAVAGNQQQAQNNVQQQASTEFGPDVVNYMKSQNATIQSLTTLIAQQQAQITAVQKQPTSFTSGQATPAGALTGYTMEEQRAGPPLTALSLYYDPSKKDPNEAFKGSTWLHYGEKFSASVGNWEKQSDGSYKTSVSSLTRTVTKPDPNDPTKTVTVGTEHIPITDAQTIYTPKGLLAGSNPVESRWTLSFGVSRDTSGYQPTAIIGYRLTDRLGIFAGTANKAALGGLTFRPGGKK